jgi:hypothetical protein
MSKTKRRKATKPRRKQPRRMTPPLFLRDAENGERSIIELDDSAQLVRTQTTGRMTVYLKLAPGLRVRVSSRCVAKRRFTELHLEPYALGSFADHAEPGEDFRSIANYRG